MSTTQQQCIEISHAIDHETNHPTGFKQYLISILMQGRISQDDRNWLASTLTFRSLLSRDQVNLLDCIFEDINAGFIHVTLEDV